MDGTTAYLSARAPVQSKTSSATMVLLARHRAQAGWPVRPRALPHLSQEGGDALARLGPAVKPVPVHAHQAGQLIAGINRDQEVLDAGIRPADQRRLDIHRGLAQQRVV